MLRGTGVIVLAHAWACAAPVSSAPVPGSVAPQPEVAVLPVLWVTTRPPELPEGTVLFAERLRQEQIFNVSDANASTLVATSVDKVDCYEDTNCLRDLGAQLGATKVIVLKIGRLGETLVTRLSWVDVADARLEHTLQETRIGADPNQLDAAYDVLVGQLRALTQGPKPWYKRGWAIGGGSALLLGATALTSWLLLRDTSSDRPDEIFTPPAP